MDKIKDVVNQVIGKIASREPEREEKIERAWKSILETKYLQHTKLLGIKDGNIFVHVDSPAWIYQMKLKKQKILKMLQEEVPEVVNISFKIGKV